MTIGCFALNTPFRSLDAQLAQIAAWGFRHADVTDNCDGASLGIEFGFAARRQSGLQPARYSSSICSAWHRNHLVVCTCEYT